MTHFIHCSTCKAPFPYDSRDPLSLAHAQEFIATYHTDYYHSEMLRASGKTSF